MKYENDTMVNYWKPIETRFKLWYVISNYLCKYNVDRVTQLKIYNLSSIFIIIIIILKSSAQVSFNSWTTRGRKEREGEEEREGEWEWEELISDLDSWDSVDAKNGVTCLDWTKDTRDTKGVLKWVLVRIATFYCARQYQIWIPEIL